MSRNNILTTKERAGGKAWTILTHELAQVPHLSGVHVHNGSGPADHQHHQVRDAQVEEEEVDEGVHGTTAQHHEGDGGVTHKPHDEDDEVETGPDPEQVLGGFRHGNPAPAPRAVLVEMRHPEVEADVGAPGHLRLHGFEERGEIGSCRQRNGEMAVVK